MAIGRQVNKIVNYTWRFKGTDESLMSMENIKRGAALASAAVAGAIAALTVSSVKVASAFVEIENQFNVVFGEAAPAARAKLDRFAESIGRSGNMMVGFAATIQDTLVPLGMQRDIAAELSVEVVKLATDLSSFKNIGLEETINRISYGLVGQHRSVQRLGIIINQTTLNQELLNIGVIGGYQAATESEKAFARLNLMYAASGDAMGDATRTAGEFENQIRVLEDTWYDVRLEIGERLIPTLNELIPEIKEMILDFGEFAADTIPPGVEGVIELAKAAKALIPVALALAAAVAANAAITGGLSLAYTALQIKAISLTGSMLTLKSAIGMGGLAIAVGIAVERIVKLNQVIGETEDALNEAEDAGRIEAEGIRIMTIVNAELTRAIEEGNIPALQELKAELEGMQYYTNPEAIGLNDLNEALGVLESQARLAAIAELELVMAMAEMKGATPDVIARLEHEIALLQKAHLIASGLGGPGDRQAPITPIRTGGGPPPDEGKIEDAKKLAEMNLLRIEQINQIEYDNMTELRDYKIETMNLELEQAQRMSDLMYSAAYSFGNELRNGGDDMLKLAIKIGLEFAKMKFAASMPGGMGLAFNFLGGFL